MEKYGENSDFSLFRQEILWFKCFHKNGFEVPGSTNRSTKLEAFSASTYRRKRALISYLHSL